MKAEIQNVNTYLGQIHHLLSLPVILACLLTIILLAIFLAVSINALNKTFNHGLKRKFDTRQDGTPPNRDVNLMCSNTFFPNVQAGVTTMIPSLFIYDANNPGGETLDNLLYLMHWGVRYPLGVPHRGYIKLYAQISERSETGLYNFEGGSCMLKISALSELRNRGLVYSSFLAVALAVALALPLYPIFTPRG